MNLTIKHYATALLCCCTALACAKGETVKLENSGQAPAARGDVSTKLTDNGNTEVKVNMEHLASPASVATGASVYVVWAKPHTGEAPQNLGALMVNDDRQGSLSTKTPLKQFDLLVTPESSGSVQHPSNAPVMKAKVVGR